MQGYLITRREAGDFLLLRSTDPVIWTNDVEEAPMFDAETAEAVKARRPDCTLLPASIEDGRIVVGWTR